MSRSQTPKIIRTKKAAKRIWSVAYHEAGHAVVSKRRTMRDSEVRQLLLSELSKLRTRAIKAT